MTTHLSLNRTPQPVLRFEPPAPTPSSRSELGKAPANTVGDKANTSLPTLKIELGEKQNLQVLGQQLAQIAKNLGVNAGPVAVASALTTTRMPVDADSALAATAGDSMTLAAYIQSMGLPQPTNHFTLTGLAKAVSHRAMEHPLGNLSGALSWPVPLSPNSQVRLRNHAMDYVQRTEEKTSGTQVKAGILDFLRDRHPLPGQIGSDPKKALDALLSSPEAQRMGKHLQEKMQGLANHSSATDYLLAAIATQMDPESINTPHRHKLAGFDLASPEFFGQPASVVVERLSQHLSSEGRVSRDMASTAARLLLTAHTPALLVKHIPDKITYGSPAWVNLTVAVMTIEAQTPGKTANMTFGEVMLEARSASVADPAVTERAQRDALLDWGVANGVLTSKADEAYTSDELNTLVSQYRARTAKMLEASVALDAPVPSRKDLALAELKKRFGDLGDLFEERLIDVRSRVYWLDDGNSYDSDSANPHSLLDVAMMDLADPYVSYSSKDSRIPIAALNANPRFGVSEDFKQQFDQVIDDKKTAIATYVKHMISQLPLADRKNFEYDDLNLYLRKFGKDYENTTKLLVQTERAAKATAYEIDFNAGVIRKTYPAGGHRRTGSKLPVDPNATLKFVPTGSQAFQNKDRPLHETLPDSFASTRTQLIADAFVSHLDLDNPDIKAQALGLTTRDKHEKKVEAVKEFFLNLIPLRSAIVNFQQGNYGAGLVDLGLDIFGFVSAGASASSKVMKISGRAWSAAYKSARIAKTIGVTTIGVLNPLSGVGDVVKGGTRLAATGIGMLRTQGIDYVNKLRGATGTYDLLKATSKQYDLAATGTYQVAGRSVAGGAVLKDAKWYAFDVDNMRPYGAPLTEFVPGTIARDGAVKALDHTFLSWLGSVVAPSPPTKDLALHLRRTVTQAQALDPVAYKQGYTSGKPGTISGYFPSMNLDQLKELTITPHITPQEVGCLMRAIEKKRIETSRNNMEIFSKEVSASGGTYTPMPQGYYLSQADVLSEGECAVLANAMALALENKQEHILINNFFTAIADLSAPKSIKFRNDMSRFQGMLENNVLGQQTPRQATHDLIIDELANAQKSKKLLIRDQGHVVLAGVSVENNNKLWFYYDPNFGLVKYPTETAMRKGLDSALHSGRSSVLLKPYGADVAKPEYLYAEFNELELMSSTQSLTSLHGLFNKAL